MTSGKAVKMKIGPKMRLKWPYIQKRLYTLRKWKGKKGRLHLYQLNWKTCFCSNKLVTSPQSCFHQWGQKSAADDKICRIFLLHTCQPLFGSGTELSLIQGPVQNQNLHSRGSKYARHLRHSALLGKAYQEKSLDIGLDTFRSLVSISAVQEWVTKTLQTPPSSRDALTCVLDEQEL